jgi:hypothetical protein
VKVTDKDGGVGTAGLPTGFVVVYDPGAGVVTGGGSFDSPAGAVRARPSLTGRATFGFDSKYDGKTAQAPKGQVELSLPAAGLQFHGDRQDWLVVAGAKAQVHGTGSLNGAPGYGFLLTAADGVRGGGADRFRIRIWNTTTGATVYDNRAGSSDDLDLANPQPIATGSIVFH